MKTSSSILFWLFFSLFIPITYSQRVTNMTTEIFRKEINKEISLKVFLKTLEDAYQWEVVLTHYKHSNTYTFSVDKGSLAHFSPAGSRANFYKQLTVDDVLFDKTTNTILLVLDKFGQVDVHKIKLNKDYSFDSKSDEILPLRWHAIVPMDMDFLGERMDDANIHNDCLYTLSKSMYQYFDIYMVNILDLKSGNINEYNISTIQIEKTTIALRHTPNQSFLIGRIDDHSISLDVQCVLKQALGKEKPFKLKTILFSKSAKESLKKHGKILGEVIILGEVNKSIKMILFETPASWYIGDIAPQSRLSIHSEEHNIDINRFIKYN